MKKIIIVSLALMLIAAAAWTAEAAKRMGGGQSFGSKPSYNQSYSPSTGASGMNRQSTAPGAVNQGVGQGAVAQKPAPGAQQPQNRGFFGGLGGLGGMFGGLLVGGLIGSMLFGHGGMGGLGGGIGLLEILLIGGLIFIGYRLLTAKRRSQETTQARYDNYATQTAGTDSRYQDVNGQNDGYWGNVGGQVGASGDASSAQADPDVLPVEADFLNGAKAAYMRLQMSWDNRDLNDIQQFVSAEVLDVISRQAKEDPKPSRTEILRLKADVLDMRRVGVEAVGSVLFEALLREDGETESKTVREVWHFSRPMANSQMFWKLEGIQQYEG